MVLSFSDAKKISISDYLSKLGYEPAKIRGNDYWYRSPLRDERDASFKVNNKLNVWYDHGTGEGGTILDLGTKLHRCTLHEFVEQLSTGSYSLGATSTARTRQEPESKIEVISVNALADETLVHYLKERSID
jgi:DNA primase